MSYIIAKPEPTDIHPAATPEQIAEVICSIEAELDRAKDRVARMNAALKEYCQIHGQLRIGEWLYYLGRAKKVKCPDVVLTVQKLVEFYGLEDLAGCLSSTTFKVGACRKTMAPAHFAACFVEWTDETLEIELVKVDTRFLPQKNKGEAHEEV